MNYTNISNNLGTGLTNGKNETLTLDPVDPNAVNTFGQITNDTQQPAIDFKPVTPAPYSPPATSSAWTAAQPQPLQTDGEWRNAQPQPLQVDGNRTPTTTPAITPAFQPQAASTAAFDPATQTVQGQIKGIIDANSPLMQQAETRANQQMNSRGLINSSMGVGAAQAALYDAAMPIAASDAQAYNQNQQFNVGQENQFKNASNNQGFDLAKMQETQRNQTAQLQQKFGYDTELTKMQTASAKETADIQAKYRNLTQASASLTSLANNASDHIHQIMMNENLDAAGKQAAIDSYNANLSKSMQLVGAFSGDVDLSTMLDELLGGGGAPAFDAAAYLKANPDVAADPWASQHPEEHYNNNGKAEGRPLK